MVRKAYLREEGGFPFRGNVAKRQKGTASARGRNVVEGASVLMHSPSVSVADSSLPEGAFGLVVSEFAKGNII